MQYDWIDFYTEFATKLLPFKADRKALIQKIYAVYDTAGISVPKLESGNEIIDIDPFTIFGIFNKGRSIPSVPYSSVKNPCCRFCFLREITICLQNNQCRAYRSQTAPLS